MRFSSLCYVIRLIAIRQNVKKNDGRNIEGKRQRGVILREREREQSLIEQ